MQSQGVTGDELEVADALEVGEGGFDRILVDGPVCCVGVRARRRDPPWRLPLAPAREVASLQRRMLAHARGLLAPDGRLVYSVCTIRRDECEGVVAGGRQTLPHRDGTDGFYIAVAS
jgi:16S rRNA (cytosine967-C5)-methyltransferase